MFPARLDPQQQVGDSDENHKAFFEAIETGRTYAPIPQWGQIENAYKTRFGTILDTAAQQGADVAVNFGPPEYSALMVFALLLVIMLAGDSILKGFISMFIGLFLATIRTDLFSGAQRFTGGQIELAGGIEFIALSVGIFAIGEVLVNIEDKTEKKLFEVPKKFRELLLAGLGQLVVLARRALGGLLDRGGHEPRPV